MRIRRLLLSLLALGLAGAAVGGFAYGVLGPTPTAPGAQVILATGRPPADANGGHHVLILGTSLTRRGDWPDLLAAGLQACAGAPLVVERLARAGAASDWGLEALRARLASADAPTPDIVIVEFSGNDASLVHGFPLFVSRRNHLEMLRLVRDAGALPILATMSPAWGWKALARPGQDRYHALYRDLAAAEGTGLIDTIADWRALSPEERRVALPDHLHPTAAAMAAITVPAFDKALRPLVCREAAGKSDEAMGEAAGEKAGEAAGLLPQQPSS